MEFTSTFSRITIKANSQQANAIFFTFPKSWSETEKPLRDGMRLNSFKLCLSPPRSQSEKQNENRQKLKSTVNPRCGEVLNEHIHKRNASNKFIELRLNGNGILVINKKLLDSCVFWGLFVDSRSSTG
jgi:hypothetical protein